MNKYFYFGEKIEKFDVRVLNEREVRAGAGILFFFAMIAFMNSWLSGNFDYTKLFVVAFLIDFFIRIFINPKFSPSMIIGKFFVSKQKVEYVGAPQKKFAWSIGFILAATMLYLVVINNVIGPVNLFVCLTCLTLLFFESAFGICIGCKIYNLFNKEKAKLCPGGTCDVIKKEEIQKINLFQMAIVGVFIVVIISIPDLINTKASNYIKDSGKNLSTETPEIQKQDTIISDECVVPDWAIAIGHAEQYKLHHNCK